MDKTKHDHEHGTLEVYTLLFLLLFSCCHARLRDPMDYM